MRGALEFLASLRPAAPAILGMLLLGSLGCSTIVDVAVDERADFSGYRTWRWASRSVPQIDAPQSNRALLDALMTRSIERGLEARGYERDGDPPDLLVDYVLSVQRRLVLVEVPRAPYLLSSLSSSASYWIEGSETQKRLVSDLRLRIDVSSSAGELVWRAELQRRLEQGQDLDLDAAVATLLGRFPERVAAHEVPSAR